MRNLVSVYVERFRQDRQKHLKLSVILAALAVLVIGLVFWQLHNTGMAMTNEVFCGQEEHIHDNACYEEVLICAIEEEDHAHDDGCYETVLTCEILEHTHTVECLIDETADVETAEDWEATLPEELSGVWADDVVAIAESQVGYTESEQNFQIAEDGETHQGYTRYGAWYGNEYGDWDAMFVSFCLNYADVPEEIIPENSGAWALSVALDEEGLYIEDSTFSPEAGDLVFFDQDEDGKADHVGIVKELELNSEDEEDNALVVIEGNSSDAVEENTYKTNEELIAAFAVLPEHPEEEATDAVEYPATADEKSENKTDGGKIENKEEEKEEKITDSGFEETEETGESLTLVSEESDYTVTVICGPEAELPKGTELITGEYESNTEIYKNCRAEVSDLFWPDEGIAQEARLFSIALISNGEEVKPAADVEVEIALAGQDCAGGCGVVRFSDSAEQMDADVVLKDDAQIVSFTTDTLSDFMVLGTNEIITMADSGEYGFEVYKYTEENIDEDDIHEAEMVYLEPGTYYILLTSSSLNKLAYIENVESDDDAASNLFVMSNASANSRKNRGSSIQIEEAGYFFIHFTVGDWLDDDEYYQRYAPWYMIKDEDAPSSAYDLTSSDKSLIPMETTYYYVDQNSDDGAKAVEYKEGAPVKEKELLAGAQFMLQNEDGQYAKFTYEENTNTYVLDIWEDDLIDNCCMTSTATGNILIEGLAPGVYTLTETAAPDGYNRLEGPLTITIADNGAVTVKTSNGGEEENAVDGIVNVLNNQAAELPNTGGMGTWTFTALGVLLTGSAATLLVYRKRKAVRS